MRNRSVARAFAIIEYLAVHSHWLPLTEIAAGLHLDEATTHRFLATLKELGYVRQQSRGARYRLSLKFAWIAAKLIDAVELRSVAKPVMARLSEVVEESVLLSVIDVDEIVYVEKVDGPQAVLLRSQVGSRGLVHSTPGGKCILAYMDPTELETYIRRVPLVPSTARTITDSDILREELRRIRDHGYAIDDQEDREGIRGVGVPILDHTGKVVAALSISGWTVTMGMQKLADCAARAVQAAAEISTELGHVAQLHSEIPAWPPPTPPVRVLAVANRELAQPGLTEVFPPNEEKAAEPVEARPCGVVGTTDESEVCIGVVGHRGRHRFRKL